MSSPRVQMTDSGGLSGEGGGVGRTRKRILDSSELHEDDITLKQSGLFSEWQEGVFKSVIPNKKGFLTLDHGHIRQWQPDDIDQGLAADLDDSLSGLGVDISTASYNMSEALLALPNVSLFKQEALSPTKQETHSSASSISFDENSQSNTTEKLIRILNAGSTDDIPSPQTFHHLLQHVNPSSQYTTTTTSSTTSQSQTFTSSPSHQLVTSPTAITSVSSSELKPVAPSLVSGYDDSRFQYILGAATSIATKVNEESLTYLNQGQSYEIKVKKLGDLTSCKGRLYHTILRICFHERRLQYMEKEQLQSWQMMRPGERIIEVDFPLSYGISDVVQDPEQLNVCEFDWDPTKEVGVYIKLNCISTEFTPKKHGGEKGVPFRIQVETYCQTETTMERLHVCACQVKVFKLKGADRKHKQDRERIMKRPPAEQEKFQRSYDCTILSEMDLSLQLISADSIYVPSDSHSSVPVTTQPLTPVSQSPPVDKKLSGASSFTPPVVENGVTNNFLERSSSQSSAALTTDASAHQTQAWLLNNRFSKHIATFVNYAGADIMRLSRGDLIEICGLADGIRLYNALHARSVIPRLTLYVCQEHEQLYHAVYLENVTVTEFTRKVAAAMNLIPEKIHDIYVQGPSGIHIVVTDEVIQNMREEAMYAMEVLQDASGNRYRLLLRLSTQGKQGGAT
ncbi:transcription factor CP2 like gemini isoform X3 [Oratosquilla oratoria]|uniref:transcription factor CP2 like gemini isoform X3 n=1 Tax=Oratosquilla oratoria TaxID=337810 RepID=UPI003F76C2FA